MPFLQNIFLPFINFFIQGIHSHTQFHPAVISVSAIVNAIIQALEPEPEVTTTGDLFYLWTEKKVWHQKTDLH